MIALLALTATAAGQTPPPKAGDVQFTANWRLRAEGWDWFDTALADGDYGFVASLLRLGITQQRPSFSWQIELAQPTLLGLPSHAIAPAPQGALGLGANYFASNGENAASIFPKQAWFQGNLGKKAGTLRAGRFEFIDGAEATPKNDTLALLKRERIAHRLIGNFGFSHVGRSFDGLRYSWTRASNNLTTMAGRVTRGVFHVDGLGELDTDVAYAAFTRQIPARHPGEFRVFALEYHDGRRITKIDNRSAALRSADHHNIRIHTVGGHWLQTAHAAGGDFDLLLWGALQGGEWGVLTQRATALAAEAGFQPKMPRLRPWIRVGYQRGSGDGDATDGRHSTFFQVLPTPRIYARFPFYNLMNSQDAFLELWLRPSKRLTLRPAFHTVSLSNRHDLWYQGGGAYEKTSFGYAGRSSLNNSGLANLVDASADWQVDPKTTLGFYFAHAAGKGVVQSIYPLGASANYGYVELQKRF